MTLKRLQLGMIHVAVAMTLVPINSTLNRVMIKELALSATLVAVLASLPYLFSPLQVAVGAFSDRHPLGGYRRSPYVILGLALCVAGVALSPHAAFALHEGSSTGILLGILAFGSWGMGYNLSSVCYLSMASELSGERGRGHTIAIMWFMMITAIILTAVGLGQMVDPYTPEALVRAFQIIGGIALVLGLLGLFRLEERAAAVHVAAENHTWGEMIRFITGNRQGLIFFVYLAVLLTALLGQDILLEPFGGEAFNLSVRQTTRITSIWGGCVLAALLIAGMLENRVSKVSVASLGGWGALLGFISIALSGFIGGQQVFYTGIVLLGVGTGLSTVSNLSLMLDMTTTEKVGLFVGAWGMSNAISRLVGSILGGAVRDLGARLTGDPVIGYGIVFSLMAALMLTSLIMLRAIDVQAFRSKVESDLSLAERAALAGDAG